MPRNGKKIRHRRIPEPLTAQEREALLLSFQGHNELRRRNLLMVKFMLNLGLRSQEVANLSAGNIDFFSGKITINGKGGKYRVLWLADADLSEVRQFVEARHGRLTRASKIFTTDSGKLIDTRFLRAMLERHSIKARIRHISPHLLRHTFATDLLRETKNLRLVQEALGHASITTTQIYSHIVNEELEAALKNFRRDLPHEA